MNKNIMLSLGFDREMKLIQENKCPFCGKEIDLVEFTDDLSLREYEISGMCQKCQDKFFVEK